ncbi:hypothetical protein [Arsenicicoccus dermatophilus]|uniref:hypothetical protein n=1 Tax=Arsenicicoccus dermatophilus TaxID=1076331 RepID=UPI0039171EA5
MNTNALRALVLVGAATIGLSACGSATTASAPATTTATQVAAPVAAAPAAQAQGQSAGEAFAAQLASATRSGAKATVGHAGAVRTTALTGKAKPAGAAKAAKTTTKATDGPWEEGKAGGQVKGATGDLKAFLVKQLRTINAGDGCDVGAIVDKRVGGYARGQYWAPECGGAAAIWADAGHGWYQVYEGQEAPACSLIARKAPKLPASLGVGCVNEAGKAVTYSPDMVTGSVTGATGDLKTYLAKRVGQINADSGDGCELGAVVSKRVGDYAKGQYWAEECGGETAIWAKGKNGWTEVFAGQYAPACSVIAAKAPQLPASLGVDCIASSGKAVTYRPGV